MGTAEEILEEIRRTRQGRLIQTEIIEYKATPLFSPLDLLPHEPWNGPPVPRFLPGWPWKWGRDIKRMAAEIVPTRIPNARLSILGRRLDGEYEGNLRNLADIYLASGNVVQSVVTLGRYLLDRVSRATPLVDRGAETRLLFHFEVTGIWDVIRELWDYLWTRAIDVDTTADVASPGRSERDYDVPNYAERLEVKARLRVENLSVGL